MEQLGTALPFAPGSIIDGRLRLLRLLGSGGMGAVYEIEHVVTKHRRALKLLHAQMAQVPSLVERFLREASAAGRIGNPHIVETFDAGQLATGEPYIVMELLEGKTLADWISEQGPLSIEETVNVLVQACDAIEAAHAAGIVHRDLKPENLFLCGAGLDFVKVLDFGISKFDANTTGVVGLTQEGTPLGTPYYMSPEQVQGERSLDGRTDVYALGVILYECLTGRKPYVAETLPHLAVLIFQGHYQQPTELRPELPKSIDALVARAMARERNDRFATAQEMAEELSLLRSSLSLASHSTPPSRAAPLSPAPSPALTPDVFASAVWRETSQPPRSRSRRTLALATLGCVAVVAAAVMFWRLVKTPTERLELSPTSYAVMPSVATGATPASNVDPSQSQPNGVQPVASIVPSPSTSTSNAAIAAPSGSARTRDKRTGLPTPSPSMHQPNRANSFGLTEKNPFD